MAGIYIHIPFCKRICSYCDFYKTTLLYLIPDFLNALEKELELRTGYLHQEPVETIYIGGGSPSVLTLEQILHLLNRINNLYPVSADCEVTLEANPDDLSFEFLKQLRENTPVNRLSVGIQSFNDDDLILLNRRHNSKQALLCIDEALLAGFGNISIDLIYGLPGMKMAAWEKNLKLAFSLEIKHLSAYHLSIEPGTAFSRMASRGLLNIADEAESADQFNALSTTADKSGFIHYEISNLAVEGFNSKHNSNYWLQKSYMGAGPSAHSYDINSRQWNISNVKKYIEAIKSGNFFFEQEVLNAINRYNEYLMLSLRTRVGIDFNKIGSEFGALLFDDLHQAVLPFIKSGHLVREGSVCRMTRQGWLISDFIISGLMKDPVSE